MTYLTHGKVPGQGNSVPVGVGPIVLGHRGLEVGKLTYLTHDQVPGQGDSFPVGVGPIVLGH